MNEQEHKILTILKEEAQGLSILEVAEKAGLNRNSAARYLDTLKNQGHVSERAIGPAKLYITTEGPGYAEQVSIYERAMNAASCGITIADARAEDMPLIYVNDAFLRITGYSRDEALGRNCRFLQGGKRDHAALKKLRQAFAEKKSCTVTLTNYTKKGEPFKNELHIAPIKNERGEVTHYIGVQTVRE